MSDPVAYGEETNHPETKGVPVPGAPRYELRSAVAQFLYKGAARALIEPLLRPGESFETVIVETFHAWRKNPKIMDCEPASIVSAVARAVQTGLVIGETVYLVPFYNRKAEVWRLECIAGYNGLIELVQRAGAARHIDAHCVYANEEFHHEQGTQPSIRHVPILDPAKRGKLVAAYAIAWVTSYRFATVVLHEREIDEIRQKFSQQWKSGEMPYWYAQKTCVRRIVKLLPKNPALARVMAMLEQEEAAERDSESGTPAHALPPAAPQFVGAGDAVSQTPNGEGEPEWMDTAAIEDDFNRDDFGEEARSEATAPEDPDHPPCPKCGGPMEDIRQTKKSPRQPDFRCVNGPKKKGDPGCPGVIWPER